MKWPCCLCLYVYLPMTTFACLTSHCETLYLHHGTWARLSSIIYNSLQSIISPLKPPKFLRQNLNIDWMDVPVFMKLDMYISCYPKPHQWHTWWIPLISNTTLSLSNCSGNTLITTCMLEPIVLTPEVISMWWLEILLISSSSMTAFKLLR
jgi:hypothetical protein